MGSTEDIEKAKESAKQVEEMEVLQIMEAMFPTAETVKKGRKHKPSMHQVSPFVAFLQRRAKVFWTVLMLVMASAYLAANMYNCIQLTQPRLRYGLIIGPLSYPMFIALSVLTLLNMAIYLPETVNTISIFCRGGGRTLFPLNRELIVSICVVHLPIATLNFFINRCRNGLFSMSQTLSGILSICYIFCRLLWYAHLEG